MGIKLLAADRAQIWMIRASWPVVNGTRIHRRRQPVTDCEPIICRAGLRSRCPGIGRWSLLPRSAVRRYRPLRRGQWYVRNFYGSYPCHVAQPAVATKTVPSPVAVTMPSASPDRKHDSLWRSLLSPALPASRSSAPPSVHRPTGGPLAAVLLAGNREPVRAEFRCRGSYTTAPGCPGPEPCTRVRVQ
jgi:hypothetical protein